MPFWPVAKMNHATILGEPENGLVDLVVKAFRVDSERDFDD